MLTPTKHTKLKHSIVYISGVIMKCIQNENTIQYDDLKDLLIDKLGVEVKSQFNLALTFLYSIGKIEYVNKLDAITLIKKN